MIRINKSKRGFTLLEIVIVIAIIVMLASVTFIAVGGYLNKAKEASSKVSAENSSLSNKNSQINASFIDLGY